MKYLKHLAGVFVLTSLLLGCGGGSSSSGVGQPHATPYAGVYDGVLNVTAQAAGAVLSTSEAYRLIVGVDGERTSSVYETGNPLY